MRHIASLVLASLLFASGAQAQQQERIATASLIADAATLEAGKPVWVALTLDIKDGWHAYWENPGDSGIPTEIRWNDLPEGATASPIHWPVPERQASSGLVNYGYSHHVVLPVAITPQQTTSGMTLHAKASWLVCHDICIPESAELSIDLPSTGGAAAIAGALAHVPTPYTGTGAARFVREGDVLHITLPRDAAAQADIRDVSFFPLSENVIQNAAPQEAEIRADSITITVAANSAAAPEGAIDGVLSYRAGGDAYGVQFRAAPSASPVAAASSAAPVAPPVATLTFAAAVLLAFAGGVLLNLMPCVLPIVALKAFAIAGKSGAARREVIGQGLAYTLGVLVSMAMLGGALYALTSAGEAVGWGFQLQSPHVVAALMILMVLVAMHLLGWFHLPNLLTRADQSLGNRKGATGSFFTGALSVAVATPCTAPFMAPALGAAAAFPPLQGLLVLLALGLGLAFPYLLICLWPAARRILPKPGPWMERFKQFLAFPMLATAVWLVWVLAQLGGAEGVGTALAGAVLLAFGIWWLRGTSHLIARALAWGVIVWAIWIAVATQPPVQMVQRSDDATHVSYSAEKLARLRAAGTPVLVDATAAWCITCKINERVALRDDAVQAAIRDHGITLMVADWTMRDDAITAYLASFGRNGVPLYVWYAPGKDGQVLPQVLTPKLVLDTFAGAS